MQCSYSQQDSFLEFLGSKTDAIQSYGPDAKNPTLHS